MNDDAVARFRDRLEAAESDLAMARGLIKAAIDGNDRSAAHVQKVISDLVKEAINDLPDCDVPGTRHRLERRRGRMSKIESDPELRMFILSRIEKMTYAELEVAIEAQFPPHRRIKRSAMHWWWNERSNSGR